MKGPRIKRFKNPEPLHLELSLFIPIQVCTVSELPWHHSGDLVCWYKPGYHQHADDLSSQTVKWSHPEASCSCYTRGDKVLRPVVPHQGRPVGWISPTTSTPTGTNSRGQRKEENQQNTMPPTLNSQSQSRRIPWLMLSTSQHGLWLKEVQDFFQNLLKLQHTLHTTLP